MKLVYSLSAAAILATIAVIFWQSSRPNRDYASAEKANTVEAYRHFLDAHPSDQRRQSVLDRIDELSWSLARGSNSVASVEDYIRRFPQGKFAKDAKELKEKLDLDSIPLFEGTMTISMGMSSGNYMKELKTGDGAYEVLTSSSTVYKGLEVSERGVVWQLGKRYKVRGRITGPPATEHLLNVKFIDARVIELVEK